MTATAAAVSKGRSNGLLSLFTLGAMPSKAVRGGLQVASLLVPLLLWTAIASLGLVDEKFLPSPQAVFRSLASMAESGATLWPAPAACSEDFFSPLRNLRAADRHAALHACSLIIYLGIGEEPKIALIFLGTIYFNILMVMDAVKFVPKELIETTLTLGGRSRQVLVQVVARYSLPSIIDTLRINIATSWNLVVVAELVAAEVGLGKRIQLAQRFFRTDQIFAELIVLGLIGFAIDMGFRLLLRLRGAQPLMPMGGVSLGTDR